MSINKNKDKIYQTVSYGSSGSSAEMVQTLLNSKGYNLTVDGIVGAKTQSAIKDFQQKNGLAVDGIVGNDTWSALTGETGSTTGSTPTSTAVSAPTAKPLPTAPTYDTTSWDSTTKGKQALGAYNDAKDAVNKHGDFKYANQAQLDSIMNSILNRDKFSYDFNEDAFYQQYKDKYIKQGKMAMADVMGQAAAMTGGYGNSYAATAGSQAYQASLEQLNDIIPELYQMAYDRYNQEGQDLYNKYGLLADDYERGYGEHQDKYNKLMDALGIARSDYYDGGDVFRAEQSNKNNVLGQQFSDAMTLWNSENDNAWKTAQWNEDARRYAEEFAYQKARDEVADSQWQKQFDYAKERDAVADSQWEKSFAASTAKSSGGTGGGGGGNISYNNGADDKGTFHKATFSRTDSDGNNVFYINGKEYTYAPGVNPYTGSTNKDVKNGTFSNGYQPNNVNGAKLSKTGITDVVNGVTQNVWKTPDGTKWIWDGTQNKYLRYED